MESASETVRVRKCELELLVRARVAVGTYASNLGRLVQLLRPMPKRSFVALDLPSWADTGRPEPWIDTQQDVDTLHVKDKAYGGSWKRRGGVGAFMMMARKWDRIENLVKEYDYDIFKMLEANPGDVADDVQDLSCYLLLIRDHMVKDDKRDPDAMVDGSYPNTEALNDR